MKEKSVIGVDIIARGMVGNALEMLSKISGIGRYLAVWDCTTGLPTTNPTTLPYNYIRGDYFIIGKVGTTNYMPDGAQYTGAASTTVDSSTPHVLDMYRYDGSSWALLEFGEEFRTILQDYEKKGKLTINGTEQAVSSHTLSWTESGVTHSYGVVTV